MSRLLRNGLVAGSIAGAALALVLLLLGESIIERAISFEHHDGPGHDELFTRATQTLGGAVGSVLFGAVLGVVFATVFAALRHRIPGATDSRRVFVLATAGWTGTVLVPFVLHPPNPPGVGGAEDVGSRTVAYLAAVLWGCTAVAVAMKVAHQLHAAGRAEAVAATGAAVAAVALVALAVVALPSPASARDLPADLVWAFRIRSIAGTTTCWTVLALAFALLVPVPARREEPVGV